MCCFLFVCFFAVVFVVVVFPIDSIFDFAGLRQDYLLQDCTDGTNLKQTFPNIDYSFMGYDILTGYPISTGTDPGFTYPIFAADYSRKYHSGDCRYSVPKGFVVIPDVACDVSFTSSVIKTMRSYERELSVSAHVSGGGWGVQFSASAGYKQAKSEISKGEYSYIISTAKCNYYTSRLQDGDSPMFDASFLQWVRKLEKSDSDADFLDFFLKYGTHFPIKVTFGARFMHQHRMQTSELETMESSGVNVGVAASYSGLFSIGGGFNLDSSQRQQASTFSSKVETKVLTVGSAPPSNADAMTWASSVQQNPVPSAYELEAIEHLFTDRYMKHLDVDYATIHEKIKKKKILYWQTVQRQDGLNDFHFNLDNAVQIPKWFVRSDYEEVDLTYNDCFSICKKLEDECYGVSFCPDCIQRSRSKCFVFGSRARSQDWEFNEKWQTILVNGRINLIGMVVSDLVGEPLDTQAVIIKASTEVAHAQAECRRKFQRQRDGRGDKAVAYSYGYIFKGRFALCKIYGSKNVLILETRDAFRTFIQV